MLVNSTRQCRVCFGGRDRASAARLHRPIADSTTPAEAPEADEAARMEVEAEAEASAPTLLQPFSLQQDAALEVTVPAQTPRTTTPCSSGWRGR